MKYDNSTSGVPNGFTFIIFSAFRVSLPDSDQKGFQDHLPINLLISLLLIRNWIKSSSITATLSEITANPSNSVTPLLIARLILSNARYSLSAKLTGRSANRTTPSAALTTLSANRTTLSAALTTLSANRTGLSAALTTLSANRTTLSAALTTLS